MKSCYNCGHANDTECRRNPPNDQGLFPPVDRFKTWCGEWRAEDAIEIREIEESHIAEHSRTKGNGPATKTGGGNRNAEGRFISKKALKKR